MEKIDRIIAKIRSIKEDAMGVGAVGEGGNPPTNSSNEKSLGYNPDGGTPPVWKKKKKYAYLGRGSRSPWLRKPPVN